MTDPSADPYPVPTRLPGWTRRWSRTWSSWLDRSHSQMAAFERDQMRRVLRRWSGRRGWLQFALVIGWNTLVAVAIASWTRKLSFLEAMSIVNLFVFSLAGIVFGAWFGFRRFARTFFRTLLLMMLFAIGGALFGAGPRGGVAGAGVRPVPRGHPASRRCSGALNRLPPAAGPAPI